MKNQKGSEESICERDTRNFGRLGEPTIETEQIDQKVMDQGDLNSSMFQLLYFKSWLQFLFFSNIATQHSCNVRPNTNR